MNFAKFILMLTTRLKHVHNVARIVGQYSNIKIKFIMPLVGKTVLRGCAGMVI